MKSAELDYVVPEFPAIVNIEVYRGKCSCNCSHCPVGQTPPNERNSRFIENEVKLELFNKICKEMAGYRSSCLRIHSVGEPLMWGKLITAGCIARKHGVRTWLFTNGVTNDLSLIEKLAETFDLIEVSVNSTSKSDYHETKGIDAFDLVKSNITRISSLVRNKALKTRLVVSRVQSADELDAGFINYWLETGLVHDAFVREFHSYNDLIEGRQSRTEGKNGPCRVHWTRLNISSHGLVVLCFNELFRKELDHNTILGDATRESLYSIWHGETLHKIRDLEKTNCTSNLPCSSCRYFQPLKTNRQTSESQLRKLSQ